MKQLRMLGALAFGLFMVGCAGNGTTVVGGGGGGLDLVGTPQIEMIYSTGFFPNPGLATLGDPMNIRTGEQVQFQLVGYTTAGVRTILTPDSWRSDDTTSTFGNLSGNTGMFLAAPRQTASPLTVTARYNGTDISTNFAVRARQVRIIGSLLNKVTHLPLQGVTIYFYDNNGVFVGPATTCYDGSFRAAMPANVARFQIVNDSLPNNVFRLIRHDSNLAVQTTAPSYLNNRNSSGTPIPVSFDVTGMQWRTTGISQQCLPLISGSTYSNTDYYLQKPILVVPFGDTDDLGNPVDPDLLAEGCSVP
jgi:hypothetical protein